RSHSADGRGLELADDHRKVVRMRGERELLAAIRPRGGAEVALSEGNIPVALSDRLPLAFPCAMICKCAVDEYHRCSLPLLQIDEINAIHARLLGRGRRRRHGLARGTFAGQRQETKSR